MLENSSSTPVDLIKLSFDDSTAREAQALASEGELAPEHAYELDWDQLNAPALTWQNSDETSIPPGGKVTLLVKCLGKIGWYASQLIHLKSAHHQYRRLYSSGLRVHQPLH